jgi:ascorbate-specific PTS system EIIC-type component UlaA
VLTRALLYVVIIGNYVFKNEYQNIEVAEFLGQLKIYQEDPVSWTSSLIVVFWVVALCSPVGGLR